MDFPSSQTAINSRILNSNLDLIKKTAQFYVPRYFRYLDWIERDLFSKITFMVGTWWIPH